MLNPDLLNRRALNSPLVQFCIALILALMLSVTTASAQTLTVSADMTTLRTGETITLTLSTSDFSSTEMPIYFISYVDGGSAAIIASNFILPNTGGTFTPKFKLSAPRGLTEDIVETFAIDAFVGGSSATAQVTITFLAPDRATTFTQINDQPLTLADGAETIDVSVNFNDPDGNPLTYRATSGTEATATVSIDPATGVLTITPVTAGTSVITVTAQEGSNPPISQMFTVTVSDRATTFTQINDQPLTLADGAETIDVSVNFNDPDGNPLTYRATSGTEATATVSIDPATGVLTITPVTAGTSVITVTAQEGSNPPISQMFTVTVTVSDRATTFTQINDQPLTLADGAETIDVSVNFNDPDGNPLTYRATSGTEATATVSIDPATGVLTITPVTAGTSVITVTAQEGSNPPISQMFTVTVTVSDRATTFTQINDQPLTLADGAETIDVSVNFNDPDGNPLTYRATSGTEATATVSIDPATGVLTITPVTAGTSVITVTAQEGSNPPISQMFTVTVTVSDRATTFTQINDQPLTLADGAETIDVSVNFNDPDGNPLTYRATSGTEATATVSIDPATGVLTITPVTAGTSVITVTAQEGSNPPISQMFTVTVGDRASTANAGPDQTVDEGDLVTLDGSGSSDPDGELTYTWTQLSGTSVTLSGADTVSPMFTAPIRQSPDDDLLVFQLVVNDGAIPSVPDTVTITVTSDVSVQKTVETINRFMHTRTNLILANQPKLSRRINRLQRGVGSEQLSFATGEITKLKPFEFNFLSLGSGNYKLATSLDQVTRAADHLQVMQGDVGGLTATHERRRFDVWFEGSFNKFNGSAGSGGDFAIAYLGADYLVSPDLLLGALLQYDRLSDSSISEDSMTEGKGWMAGPYVTARLQDNLYLDARLAWGKSDNDIRPPGATYTDSFTSIRRLANISLSGEFSQGQWTLRPNASLSYMADKQSAYTNTLGTTIPSQTVSSGQLRLGPNVSTQFTGANGWVYEPSVTLDAIYSHADTRGGLSTTPSPQDGWRARLEAGLGMTISESSRLSFTGNYDGIGQSGFEAWGLGLNLDMKF